MKEFREEKIQTKNDQDIKKDFQTNIEPSISQIEGFKKGQQIKTPMTKKKKIKQEQEKVLIKCIN